MTKAPKTTPAKAAEPAPAEPATDQFADLHVIEFGVENFMRVEAVIVRPDPANPVVELSGRNRQGKTSVLRALASVFTGRNALPMAPIRRGETESRVWAILGKDGKPEITIEEQLSLKDGGEVTRKLLITPAEGRPVNKPQALLDRLYEPIAFAPFEFARRPPKDQLDVVKALVPGVDFADLAERRKAAFEERTIIGRDRDKAKARYNSAQPPAGTPADLVDLSELAEQISKGYQHNQTVATRKRTREEAAAHAEAKLDQAERLRAQAATLETEAADFKLKLAHAEPLPELVDVAALQAKVGELDKINANVRLLQAREAARIEHRDAEAEVARLTALIEAIDIEKTDAIEAANLPIEGLELGDDCLLLNGLPLDQASGREKIEVGVRIGMAINPGLKLIVVEEGALLDDDGVETLATLAGKHGFLVVIERVTNGEKVGITIEDGKVLA